MSRGTTAPGRTFGDRARSPALASFLLDCLCTGGLGVGGREACPPGQPCRMGAGVFSPRSQVGTCGPSLKPAHPLVGRLAMFILEIHWGAWVLCRWPSLDKGQAQELPVFLSSAGDKSQCLQKYRGGGHCRPWPAWQPAGFGALPRPPVSPAGS